MKFQRHITTGFRPSDADSTVVPENLPDPFDLMIAGEEKGRVSDSTKNHQGQALIRIERVGLEEASSFSIANHLRQWIAVRDLPKILKHRIEPLVKEMRQRSVTLAEFFLRDGHAENCPPFLDGQRILDQEDFFCQKKWASVVELIFWFVDYQNRLSVGKALGFWRCPSCGGRISSEQSACHYKDCSFRSFYEECFGQAHRLETIATISTPTGTVAEAKPSVAKIGRKPRLTAKEMRALSKIRAVK